MGFLDLNNLRRHYAGQASQLVNDFYVPVLGQATCYDRQSGYFDSSSLVQKNRPLRPTRQLGPWLTKTAAL